MCRKVGSVSQPRQPMVSELLSAVCADVLHVAGHETFFTQTKEGRTQRSSELLSTAYPQPLRAYLALTESGACTADLNQLIPILGTQISVFVQVPALIGAKNQLFQAFLDALPLIVGDWLLLEASGDSALAKQCRSTSEAGVQYERILTREAQELFLLATNIDSPTIQVATALDRQERRAMMQETRLPGIPMVQTNTELLGGARQFYRGTMQDDSWRARLTRVLTVVT